MTSARSWPAARAAAKASAKKVLTNSWNPGLGPAITWMIRLPVVVSNRACSSGSSRAALTAAIDTSTKASANGVEGSNIDRKPSASSSTRSRITDSTISSRLLT